jgi:uncharacterized membrane protein
MFLFFSLLIGGAVILGTVIIHAVVYDWILKILPRTASLFAKYFGSVWKIPLIGFVVLCILSALFIDIWLWTALLMIVDPINLHDIESGLYFAATSFTTVGYGDIVLEKHWRILGTICAINGMFLFGWSAAFIYEIMAKLYDDDKIIKKKW